MFGVWFDLLLLFRVYCFAGGLLGAWGCVTGVICLVSRALRFDAMVCGFVLGFWFGSLVVNRISFCDLG